MIQSEYLLPQVDYCIQLFKSNAGPTSGFDVASLMNEHALFLEQPTEMWMWLPCDEKGDIMTKPSYQSFGVGQSDYDDKHDFDNDMHIYNVAVHKCLFRLPEGVPENVDLINYIEGICMHCFSLNEVVNANFKLRLKPSLIKKFNYVNSL